MNNVALKKLLKDKRGSPLIEEGLLVGLAILAIALLVILVLNVIDWAHVSIDSIVKSIEDLLPF
ncbi:MAG: hypothetical protein ACTSSJ_03275 [Candidatus Odinarchaeia archaeon]